MITKYFSKTTSLKARKSERTKYEYKTRLHFLTKLQYLLQNKW